MAATPTPSLTPTPQTPHYYAISAAAGQQSDWYVPDRGAGRVFGVTLLTVPALNSCSAQGDKLVGEVLGMQMDRRFSGTDRTGFSFYFTGQFSGALTNIYDGNLSATLAYKQFWELNNAPAPYPRSVAGSYDHLTGNGDYNTGNLPEGSYGVGITDAGAAQDYQLSIPSRTQICYGTHEPLVEEPKTSLICDGDMEQYYTSSCWVQSDFGTVTKPDGSTIDYTWDRINTGPVAPWPLDWSNWWNNGDAVCGTGYHAVGKQAVIGTNLWAGQGKGAASAIEQNFTWGGGTLYWRASARGKFMRFFPTTPKGKAVVSLEGNGSVYNLVDAADLQIAWTTFHGSLQLPAGSYKIKLDSQDKQTWLQTTIDDGAVYFDDIFLSETALSGQACEGNNGEELVTVTPTGTLTPNASETALATPTGSGALTPTVGTPTPTITPNPELLQLWNCGFEAGSSNWGLNQNSSIVLSGGQTGPQALRSTGIQPNAWQVVYSKGAQTYFTGWVKGQVNIRAVNLATSQTITYYDNSSYLWSWTQLHESAYLPSGTWRFELNTSSPPGGEAFFDGVILTYNGFANSSQTWCAATPTPGPTAFLTATQQRTPTTGPTSTPWPTATSAFWWTPIPTGTLAPSVTPNFQATSQQQTATAQGTPNVWAQTATAWGTATAQGTPPVAGGGTGFQGTPWATPPYGSGGVGGGSGGNGTGSGPCPKPDFWKDGFGTWIDAAVCEAKYFTSWSSGNSDQVAQFANDMKKKEPFGTVGELSDALQTARIVVESYNWSNTGLPGTRDSQAQAFSFFTNRAPSYMDGIGSINLQGGSTYSASCSSSVTSYAGPRLSPGICFIFNILRDNHIMPIFQFFIDGSCLLALLLYIRNQWLKYM